MTDLQGFNPGKPLHTKNVKPSKPRADAPPGNSGSTPGHPTSENLRAAVPAEVMMDQMATHGQFNLAQLSQVASRSDMDVKLKAFTTAFPPEVYERHWEVVEATFAKEFPGWPRNEALIAETVDRLLMGTPSIDQSQL